MKYFGLRSIFCHIFSIIAIFAIVLQKKFINEAPLISGLIIAYGFFSFKVIKVTPTSIVVFSILNPFNKTRKFELKEINNVSITDNNIGGATTLQIITGATKYEGHVVLMGFEQKKLVKTLRNYNIEADC